MNKEDIILIENEIKGCFDYFWNEISFDDDTFGLVRDKTGNDNSSIAAIGFSIPAYVIGVERGFVTFDEARIRILKTIETLKRIKRHHGFFPHFIDMETGLNNKSEYSTIDTSILLIGGIVGAEYFGGTIKEEIYKLIDELDWDYFITERNGLLQIIMAYSDYYWKDNLGFCPATWDQYAEHIMMYFLIAGRKDVSKDKALKLYNGFIRHNDRYSKYDVVHCYSNPLFIHQFTHAFFPFQEYLDCNGFDWFQNSINATLANREFCMRNKHFKTYHKNSWGLTAFQGEKGYKVFGSKPYGLPNIKYNQRLDGSVAPYASLCSINFTPRESIHALRYFQTIPGLIKKYGLTDSYNLDTNFVSDIYLGIDKGPTIIMLDNFLNGTTWKYFMSSEFIKNSINKLNFKRKGEEKNEKN